MTLMRTIARGVAESYFAQREKLGFPGLKNTLSRSSKEQAA